MKTSKTLLLAILLSVFVTAGLSPSLYAQKADFGGQASPYHATIVAGTDTHDSTSAFATLTSASHNFGATATVTVDTLDIGMDDQVALPFKNSRVFRALTAGAADTVASQDVAEGTYALTDVPDGATEQEVYFRTVPVPAIIAGGDSVRVVITGGTVTGSDVRDVIVRVLKY